MKLTKEEKNKIEEAVKLAESKTSGEIVPVLLKKSDLYPAAHFRSAILFSFILNMCIYYLPIQFLDDPIMFLWGQIIGLLVGYFVGYFSRVKRFLSTRREIREEVHQRAIEAFFDNNLHTTRDRTGILIMVSMLERRAEILADSGIDSLVEKETWGKLLGDLILDIKKNDVVDGFCRAISNCGDILSEKFPIKDDDTNELSNQLITDDET